MLSVFNNIPNPQCKCKDPSYKGDPSTNCYGSCGFAPYKGDGNCDDNNNNCGCAYDGGDCCAKSVTGGTVNTKYCTEVCLEGINCSRDSWLITRLLVSERIIMSCVCARI